jgi:hypothetical protein
VWSVAGLREVCEVTQSEHTQAGQEAVRSATPVAERALVASMGLLLVMIGIGWPWGEHLSAAVMTLAAAAIAVTVAALGPGRVVRLPRHWAPVLQGALVVGTAASVTAFPAQLRGLRVLIPGAIAALGLIGVTRRFRPTDPLRASLTGLGVFTALYGLLATAPRFPDVHWALDGCRKMGWLGLAVWLSFLLCAPGSTGRERSWRLRLAIILFAGVAGRGLAILASPNPVIDVFIWGRDAPRVLLQGRNPYATVYENPYITQRARERGLDRWADSKQGFYPPWTTLTGAVPTLLGLDVRWLNAVADGVAALLLVVVGSQARRPDIGILCASIYLCAPRSAPQVELGYMEPQLAALLGGFVCLASGWPGVAGALLGMAVAAKQSTVLVAVPAIRYLWRRPQALLAAAAVTVAVVLPFFVWGPDAFLETVLRRQMGVADSSTLSVMGLLLALNWSVPGWLLWAVRLPVIAAITARAPGDRPLGLGLWFAAVSIVFFWLNNIAFANHYHSIAYLLLLGIAGNCDCERPADEAAGDGCPALPVAEGQ